MRSDAGALLVENELITEEQLQNVLSSVVQYGGTLIQNLIRMGYLSDEDLAGFLSDKLQVPMAEDSQFANLPAFITRLVPGDLVLAHRLIPIMLHQGVLHVAMADPTDRAALEEIAFSTGYQASAVVAPYRLIELAMARYYAIPPEDSQLPPAEDIPTAPAVEKMPASEFVDTMPPSDLPLPGGFGTPGPFDQGPPTQPPFLPAVALAKAGAEASASAKATADETGGRPPVSVVHPVPEPLPDVPAPEAAADRKDQLEVVEDSDSSELEELFFGLGREDGEIVHLTRVKGNSRSSPGTIADAVRSQTASSEDDSVPLPEPEAGKLEPLGSEERQEYPAEKKQDPALEGPIDGDKARLLIREASDRDEVARVLVRFSLAFMPRCALFIVKKDILVGWMGGGEEVTGNQVKGIMIPLGSPSVFRTVRETETDYFGSLPRTTVNDIFVSALGDVRPSRVLLVPITVRHKPICILYGDCGTEAGFSKDLSPIHLLITDVSAAFERIILQKKIGRRVIR